jgi:hypothetical protein
MEKLISQVSIVLLSALFFAVHKDGCGCATKKAHKRCRAQLTW